MKRSDAHLSDLFQTMLEAPNQYQSVLDGEARLQDPGIQHLQKLVEMTQALEATVRPVPDMQESLTRMRTRVLSSITDSVYTTTPARNALPEPLWWQRFWHFLQGPAVQGWATAAVATLLVVALTMTTAISASAQSLPGQPLYPVKRLTEQAHLLLTIDPVKKSEIKAEQNQERLHEITSLQYLGKSEQVSFDGELQGREDNGWRIGDWLVIMQAGDAQLAKLPIGTRIHVTGVTPGVASSDRIIDATWSVIHIPVTTPTPTPTPTLPPAQPGDLLISAPTDTPAPVQPTPTPEPRRKQINVKLPPTATPPPTATFTATSTATVTPTPTATGTPLPTPIPEFQATGRLTGITPTSIVVEGIVYQLAPGLSADTLQIGSQVSIVYRLNADQSRLVRQIIVLVAAPTPSFIQRSGRFEAVDSGSITVNGTRFLFSGSTQFPSVALAVGQFGRVSGHTAADGVSLFADKIEIYYLGDIVLLGTVRSVQGNIIEVDGMGGSVRVDIGQATIKGRVQVGAEVSISGKVRPDGLIVADSVTVTPPPATATPTPTRPAFTLTPTLIPTLTPTFTPSPTPLPTATPAPATATPEPTASPTSIPPSTLALPTPQPTPTPEFTFASPTPATPY